MSEHLERVRREIRTLPVSPETQAGMIAAVEALYVVKAKPRCWNQRDPDTLYIGRAGFCKCRVICEQAI